jgi:RecB family exonuclease
MRIGQDGRFGLRLSQPGSGRSESALAYKALADEQLEAEAREERRLFYVAMTRAKERLILSGAANLAAWPTGPGGGPIGWIGPAVVPDLAARAERREDGVQDGVRVRFFDGATPSAPGEPGPAGESLPTPSAVLVPAAAPAPREPAVSSAPGAPLPPAVTEISYSSLGEHRRCGYRFYVQRVLRLPPVEDDRAERPSEVAGGMGAAERGTLVHALLERIDFKRPITPDADAIIRAAEGMPVSEEEVREIGALLKGFLSGEVSARLGRATTTRSEQAFAFLLRRGRSVLIRGVFDVIAYEPGGRALVVDYKTDRIEGAEPESVVASAYAAQRLIYALAAMRAGAREVEVVHAFLEVPERPATARFTTADLSHLEAELAQMASGVLAGDFVVSPLPHRALCRGCPAEGGLCSWPLAATRREAPDRLF